MVGGGGVRGATSLFPIGTSRKDHAGIGDTAVTAK